MCKNISENYAREYGKELLNLRFGSEFVRICVF